MPNKLTKQVSRKSRFGLFFTSVALILIARAFVSDRFVNLGDEVYQLEQKRSQILAENMELENQLAGLGSYAHIMEVADSSLGLSYHSEAVSYVKPPALASR